MDLDTFYPRNAAAFLDSRQLRMGDLHGLALAQYEDTASVLLTSSAVHGIANACSDIDLICVRHGDVTDIAMATQLHCGDAHVVGLDVTCLLYTSPSPRDRTRSRMPSSA